MKSRHEITPQQHRGPFGPPYGNVVVDGEIVDEDDARVSVNATVVSYGLGTFEGIRAFWNADRGQLFLSEAVGHFDRLGRSARMLGLDFPYTTEQLVSFTKDLLVANDVKVDAYVRPIYFLAGEVLPVRMHDITPRLAITCHPIPGDYVSLQGVRCMVSSWRRQPDASTPVRAKVIGSYVGPALAKTEAVRCGFDEAILLTHDGFVAEATTSNVMIKAGGRWHTPAGTDDILLGITRAQVMAMIAETTGETVVERRIHRSELYVAEEALLCGTAATVGPIVSVDGRSVGNGRPGEQTGALRDVLRAIARRTDERHPEWSTSVYE